MPLINVLSAFTLALGDSKTRSFPPGRHMATDAEWAHPDMARHAKLDAQSSDAERAEADRNAAAIRLSGKPFVPPEPYAAVVHETVDAPAVVVPAGDVEHHDG